MDAQHQVVAIVAHGVDVLARQRAAIGVAQILHKAVACFLVEVDPIAVGAHPHAASAVDAQALRAAIVGVTGVTEGVEREPLVLAHAEHALVGHHNPDVALAVVVHRGHPVGHLHAALCLGGDKTELLGLGVEDKHALVGAHPQVLLVVLIERRDIVVASSRLGVGAVKDPYCMPVIAVQAVAGPEPHESALVLQDGLDVGLRQAIGLADVAEVVSIGIVLSLGHEPQAQEQYPQYVSSSHRLRQ